MIHLRDDRNNDNYCSGSKITAAAAAARAAQYTRAGRTRCENVRGFQREKATARGRDNCEKTVKLSVTEYTRILASQYIVVCVRSQTRDNDIGHF